MDKLYFITGNSGKFREAKDIIPYVEQQDLDLIEIQDMDPKKIIESKLLEGMKKIKGRFFCEDTSLFIEGLNGLPGPFIKFFYSALGNEGIAKMAIESNNPNAIAKTLIGYSDGKNMKFFESEMKGVIVNPRGNKDFGWGPIFQPDNMEKTLGEMELKEKNALSMRSEALKKLKKYLEEEKDGK